MSEEKNCGCGCGHDHEHNHEHEGCGCGHDHGEEQYIEVELEDENGNAITCYVIDGFTFNDKEYAVVENPTDNSLYLFEVVGDEDVAELVLPADDEFEAVREYYESLILDEEDDEE